MRIFLRRRIDLGVTSIRSSSPIYSIASSREKMRGGVRSSFSSAPEDRIAVRCLVLQGLTAMSY